MTTGWTNPTPQGQDEPQRRAFESVSRQFWNTAWGIPENGYASATTMQNNIGVGLTDVTALTVTWTAVENRRYRATCGLWTRPQTTFGAPAFITVYIFDGITQRQSTYPESTRNTPAGTAVPCFFNTTMQGLAVGSHTTKVTVNFSANVTANEAGGLAATDPAFFYIEDIGPTVFK